MRVGIDGSKHWYICLAASLAVFSPFYAMSACPDGMALPPRLQNNEGSSIYIKTPGAYCMWEDLAVESQFDIHAGRFVGGHGDGVLNFQISGIDLDLGGHALKARAGGVGGIRNGLGRYSDPPKKNHIIRNGSIYSAADFGVLLDYQKSVFYATRSDVEDYYSSADERLTGFQWSQAERQIFQERSSPLDTNHQVMQLKIEVGTGEDKAIRRFDNIGIGIKGGSNIIRGNRIVVTDPYAGIYLVGRNQVIEDNVIILKGDAAARTSAAIKLHLAHGSVIRNNTIIVQGLSSTVDQAISLIESKDVIVEGNTIKGVKQIVRTWDEQSSAIERDNKVGGWSIFD